MRPGFNEWMLHIAQVVSLRSRDKSTKVGCVIMRPDKSICSVGYNGFPRRIEDKDELWLVRETKYDRVIHAEMNAILAAKESVSGYVMFTTRPPCKECAKHLIAANIRTVVWSDHSVRSLPERAKGSVKVAKQLYKEADVQVVVVG